MTKGLLHLPPTPPPLHPVQLRDSTCSHTDFQLTSPRTHFYQSSKVPCINRLSTASSLTQWIPTPPTPVKSHNDHCTVADIAPSPCSLLSSPPIWQSENSNKNTNKNLPRAQARTAQPDILISFKSNCSKWLVELGHFPLLPLNWKYNCGRQ